MLLVGLRLLLPMLAAVEPGSQKCQGKEVISGRMVCLCGSERRLVLCKGEGSSGMRGVSHPRILGACVCSYTVLETLGWTFVPTAPALPLIRGCREGHGAEPRACGCVVLGRMCCTARHPAALAFGVPVVGP